MTMVANYGLLREAYAIADGSAVKAPTRAHLVALIELIESLRIASAERLDVIESLMQRRAMYLSQ